MDTNDRDDNKIIVNAFKWENTKKVLEASNYFLNYE